MEQIDTGRKSKIKDDVEYISQVKFILFSLILHLLHTYNKTQFTEILYNISFWRKIGWQIRENTSIESH